MDKLQKLTQKLYEEGLSKGRSDADDLVAKAKAEAAAIVNEAKVKAEAIVAEARRAAGEMQKNTETEVALASRQTIAALKEQIQHLVTAKELTPRVKDAVDDKAFLQNMILLTVKNWEGNGQTRTGLEVMLPQNAKEELLGGLRAMLENALDDGVVVTTGERVKSGFRVAPKDGGYYISFTDEDFDALFQEYLRPKVAELLFGKN
jgi:V/A-type H+-transporting ATPase subunit E